MKATGAFVGTWRAGVVRSGDKLSAITDVKLIERLMILERQGVRVREYPGSGLGLVHVDNPDHPFVLVPMPEGKSETEILSDLMGALDLLNTLSQGSG